VLERRRVDVPRRSPSARLEILRLALGSLIFLALVSGAAVDQP
jgi:hypothetical protein